VLEIVWLADLLRQQQQQPGGSSGSSGSSSSSVFSVIPESVLSDAASWLTFVIQMREAEQLAAVDIGECWKSSKDRTLKGRGHACTWRVEGMHPRQGCGRLNSWLL
jgi:hypothetical protein